MREAVYPPKTVNRAVLLAGGLKPPPLAAAAGCSVLDLWLTPQQTVLDLWLVGIRSFGDVAVTVLCSRGVPRPEASEKDAELIVLEDPADYRGPAGALRDACADMAPHDTILVGEATRFLDADLGAMLATHAMTGACVTVACNADRTPAGVYLLERSSLDLVPKIGFMDLKEQWLGKVVAGGLRTVVHQFCEGGSHAIRTREQFLAAASLANNCRLPQEVSRRDSSSSRVVSERAVVHESARLWGSVVMGRAIIEPGAIVVRSLIGPGARVPQSAVIVDQVIPALGAYA